MRLRAQAGEQRGLGPPQLDRGGARGFARLNVVDDGLVAAARLEARAHDRVAMAEAAQPALDPLSARFEAVARRAAVAHDRPHLAHEPLLKLDAAQLEPRAQPGSGLEHDGDSPARRIVGLDELDARTPEAALDEPAAHRLARRLRLLLLVDLPRTRPGERVQRGRGLGVAALDAHAPDADPGPGPDPEHRVRAARHGPRLRLDQRLEAAAPRQRQGHVAAGALEARLPERVAGTQARQVPDRPSRDHGVTLDPDLDQQGRRDRAEHHVYARLALAAHDLDTHVLEAPGGEDQLDGATHRLGVERPARHEPRRTRRDAPRRGR